jgi:acyl carrier protein
MSDSLIQLFAEVLGVDPKTLNDDSSPQNVKQWDSLAAMELVSAIEQKFNVRLSTKEIMKMSTIGLARKTLRAKNSAAGKP